MSNNKQSNIAINVLEAIVTGDSSRSGSDRTKARVAIYAGGAGDERQTLWATVVIDDSRLSLSKGQRIRFEGDLKLVAPSPGYEDRGPSTFIYVAADKYEVLERQEPRRDKRRAPAASKSVAVEEVEETFDDDSAPF
jgi:hypothetical protein